MVGASPLRVALDVSLPMVGRRSLYAAVLVFFLGFELFGLPLVLGDPEGILVLTTYLYKLTNMLGRAVLPADGGGGGRDHGRSRSRWSGCSGGCCGMSDATCRCAARALRASRCGWALALAGLRVILAWFLVTVVVPIGGIMLRSFVDHLGRRRAAAEVLTLEHYRDLAGLPERDARHRQHLRRRA